MSVESEAEELAAKYPNIKAGPSCTVGLSPHKELIEALCARGLYATRVSEVIDKEKGARLAADTIRRHFKKECLCRET